MFTGLIETTGVIVDIKQNGNAGVLQFKANKPLENLQYGESIAVNGVCLTLSKEMSDGSLEFHTLSETLKRTNLGTLMTGDIINIERAVPLGGRMGGHLVQGHIDTTSEIREIRKAEDDYVVSIKTPASLYPYLIPKGSITIDGISLTLVEVNEKYFTVHIIPVTLEDTSLKQKKTGDLVNLESDLIGKYVYHQLSNMSNNQNNVSKVNMESLINAGF